MEERNNTTTPATAAKKCSCGWGAFVVGLVVALILGWWVLPNLMKETKKQPIAFSHVEHVQKQGMTCEQCHFVRADGSFSGTPTTAQCAECHFTVLGSNPEEARFVRDYVQTGPRDQVGMADLSEAARQRVLQSRSALRRACRTQGPQGNGRVLLQMPPQRGRNGRAARLSGKQAFGILRKHHADVGVRTLPCRTYGDGQHQRQQCLLHLPQVRQKRGNHG